MAKTIPEIFIVLGIAFWIMSTFFSILTISNFKLKHIFVLSVPILNLFYCINDFEGIKNKLNPFHYFILGCIFWITFYYAYNNK
jgi:hypothetical protein